MAKQALKQKPKKRTYNTSPLTKIQNGEPWAFHFKVDPDVALCLISENEDTGAEIGKLINNSLRKTYAARIKKANKVN